MSLFDKINLPQIYKVHSFTSGTSTFAVTGSGDVEVLVIGAGAGGSADNYGGGGSGGMSEKSGHAVTAQSYNVVVGTGGAGGVQSGGSLKGSNGSLSSFDSIVSNGGGAGGINTSSGNDGGSGGGCGTTTSGQTGGDSNQGDTNGATGYGFDGGDSPQSGGGGAGQVGQAPNGGNGRASSISGESVYYAGGGASVNGTGGIGGGGDGNASFSGSPSHGTANTGSGGGSGHASAGGTAGNGGSGVVIIRYLNSSGITATGGTISYAGVANQRVVENFSGSVLDTDRWNVTTTGNGTATMEDDGLKLTSDSGATGGTMINFNNIRQYSQTGSVCINVCKRTSTSNAQMLSGFTDTTGLASDYVAIKDYTSNTYKQLSTANNGTATHANSSVAIDVSYHTHKIECLSSSVVLYIDGVSEVTNTTNLPNVKMQPFFYAGETAGVASAKSAHIRYMEAYNT
jgi:hypothetical protein